MWFLGSDPVNPERLLIQPVEGLDVRKVVDGNDVKVMDTVTGFVEMSRYGSVFVVQYTKWLRRVVDLERYQSLDCSQ